MSESQDPSFDTDVLLDKLGGRPSDAELDAYFDAIDAEFLHDRGAQVSTRRIRASGIRIVGDALSFVSNATAEQLALLPTVTDVSLRLTLGAILAASDAYDAKADEQSRARAARSERRATADSALDRLIAWRDVLFGTNRTIAGFVEPYATRIQQGYAKAEDAASVCTTVRAQIAIARELLKDKSPSIVTRRKTTRLSTSWLEAPAALADRVEQETSSAATMHPAPHLPDGKVDLLDGRALVLLDELIAAFDRGHEAMPTIPRLSPYGLWAVLRPRKAKKPAGTTPDVPPDTPTA